LIRESNGGALRPNSGRPAAASRLIGPLIAVVLMGAGFAGPAAPAASAAPAAPRASAAQPESVTRTNRVLVRWSSTLPRTAARASDRLRLVGAASDRKTTFIRTTGSGAAVYDLGSKLGVDAPRILAALRRIPGAVSVEPDVWVTADALPNDPQAAQLWGLLGTADGSPYGIDALGAWATTNGAGVVVAVIDTGRVDHPDLTGQWVAGYDMISDLTISNDGNGRDTNAADPGDACGSRPSTWHGTHVAGTIAALAGNGVGVFGGAPGVKIQPIRVLGTCGGYSSDVADGIRWAAGGSVPGAPPNATPARVLNLSLGGSSPSCPAEYTSAIADARSRGAVVVVAAGNAGSAAAGYSPANCQAGVTVAAIDSAGKKASFSNFGPPVELAGPGVGIISTINSGSAGPISPTYASYNGTSMAAPHVALTAALIAASDPSLAPDAIEAVLEATAIGFAADGSASGCPALGCGSGVVNAGQALAGLAGPNPIVGRVAPTVRFPMPAGTLSVNAVAVDQTGVASAELSIDGGSWVPMTAVDGAFGEVSETVSRTITAPSSEGDHAICVRATDPDANTSDGIACATITVDAGPPSVGTPVPVALSAGQGSVVEVTASVTDGVSVASAQVSVDGGPWTVLGASDGAFGESSEGVTGRTAGSVVQLDVGNGPTCALLGDSTVRCWGFNEYGQLGDGTTIDRHTPVAVTGLSNVVAVDAGYLHSCAVLADTTVRCWGFNEYGQLGDGTTIDRLTPVAVAGLTGVESLAVGDHSTCALLDDATVRCWGRNLEGQLGDGTSTNRPNPVPVSGLANVTGLSGSTSHTCARLTAGTVRCWGWNPYGALGDGSTTDRHTPVAVAGLSNVVAVRTGYYHSCALLVAAMVRCWGGNGWGQLGDGTMTDRLSPVAVSGLSNVSALDVGGQNGCVVLANATARCWGANTDGQVGDGTFIGRTTPVAVSGLGSITALSVGGGDSCAVLADATARCWGVNLFGEVGDGTVIRRPTPRVVAGIGSLAGADHDVCVRATDSAGRTSAGTSCATLTVADTTAPAVLIFASSTASPTSGTTIAYTLSFGEPVSGLAAADFTIGGTSTGWSITGVSGGGAGPYTINLVGSAATAGTISLALEANAVADLAANPGPTDALSAADVVVTRIVATLTGPASPTNATTLTYAVNFSEAITGLTAADFTRTGSAGGCVVGTPAGSGASRTVALTGCGAGTVILGLKALSITNLAGHAGPTAAVTAATVVIDRTRPTTSVPLVAPRTGVAVSGSSIPVNVTWSGSDSGVGIARHEIARSTNGGTTWTTLSTALTGPSHATTFPSSGSVRFRVRAVDLAGNAGLWATGPVLTRSFVQQNAMGVTFAGGWTTVTAMAYSGGSARYASAAGAAASYTFTGRSVALVTTLAPSRGRVRIYVNGTLVTTLDCSSAGTTYQVVAWQRTYSATVTRTVRLVVEGTAGRPRVDLDAFAILK
jgi:subtilisin family serine protease/alpha-tubulin suppressor-like RCC1 family protein